MPVKITIPRLGWSMEEATFGNWLKQDGDQVKPGEALFTVESDKVTMDVESLDSGVLYLPPDAPEPAAVVRVGQVVGYLLAEGEQPPVVAGSSSVETPHGSFTPLAVPEPASVAPRITRTGSVPVSPRARRVAAELGVDTSGLQGTGRGGRIREQDVRAAAQPQILKQTIPVSSLRRTIADRMVESRKQTVPVTLTCRLDASRLTALRNRWKLARQPAPAPSFSDIVVKLVAIALAQHPALGGRWEGDRIAVSGSIDIGIAVDTEHGLIVPVIRKVPDITLEELAERSRRLIDAARRRQIQAEDMNGGVFTITNLGSFGVEAFTPIINYPETAVLGLGAIRWEPAVSRTGQIVAREQMMLSLTFDHRVVDGAPAARFLQAVAELIEEPPPEVYCP